MIKQISLVASVLILAPLPASGKTAGEDWSFELGAGVARPTLGLGANDGGADATLTGRAATKAQFSPYLSVRRAIDRHWALHLTYQYFGQSGMGSPDQVIYPPIVCNGNPPVCVQPLYVLLLPGRSLRYSAHGGYVGLTRVVPLNPRLSFEGDATAGLALVDASGAVPAFDATYASRSRVNFSWGASAGLVAAVAPGTSVVARLGYTDLGKARTGLGNTLFSDGVLSSHPTVTTLTLGLRFKL